MSSKYTLASAGGADFVRPMEMLMQMVHERYNMCVHLDAWSLWNFDNPQGYTTRIQANHIYQNIIFPGMERGSVADVPLPRCSNLWRSTMHGVPQGGSLRRYDQHEDWDLGRPFGVSHDLRLGYLSDMLYKISPRFISDLDPEDIAGFNHLTLSRSPKLSVSQVSGYAQPASFYKQHEQLVTVDHFTSMITERAAMSTIQHKVAMPIAGQGLLSAVRVNVVGASEAWAGGPHTAPLNLLTASVSSDWVGVLPADTLSPGWGPVLWTLDPALVDVHQLRLQVCIDDNGVPGAVAATTTLTWKREVDHVSGGVSYLSPRFIFHRPVVLDHTKVYWLVIDAPRLSPDRSYSLGLSDVTHIDTQYQLKTWNGTAWVNHAQPALKFSLHMPQFMWRSKQLWIRASELKQLVHYRSNLHSEGFTKELGVGNVFYHDTFHGASPGDIIEHDRVRDWILAARSSTAAYTARFMALKTQRAESFSNSESHYFSNWFAVWPGAHAWNLAGEMPNSYERLSTISSFSYLPHFEIGPPAINYVADLGGLQRNLRERPPKSWKFKSFRTARFEYRTGVRVAALDTPFQYEGGAQGSVGPFEVGELLTLHGGLALEAAQLEVLTVDADALPTSFRVVNPGRYLKLLNPQRNALHVFKSGARRLRLKFIMKVSEVVIVDGGEGYASDCPIALDSGPAYVVVDPANPDYVGFVDTFSEGDPVAAKWVRARGRVTNGRVTSVSIQRSVGELEEGGAGYSDGGIAISVSQLMETDQTADPSMTTIWPDVRYFVNTTGPATSVVDRPDFFLFGGTIPTTTGYEAIGGEATHLPKVRYNGVDYYPGESFVGVSGVSEFSLIPQPGVYASSISAGLEIWCHHVFGCDRGPRNTAWANNGRLMARADGDRVLPVFNPKVTNTWHTLGSMAHNGLPLAGVVLGAPPKFTLPGPVNYDSASLSGAAYFLKPAWDIDLDMIDNRNGLSGATYTPNPGSNTTPNQDPGLTAPEGTATIVIGVDNAGVGRREGGTATITVAILGEGSIQDIRDGEGEAEIEVAVEGEGSVLAVGEAEGEAEIPIAVEGEGEGEGSGMMVGNGEGEAGISVDVEGEASAAYTATMPTTSPDVWWSMEEASGTRVDVTRNGYDLDEVGDETFSGSGRVGAGVAISGPSPSGPNRFLGRLDGSMPDHTTDWTWCGWAQSIEATIPFATFVLDVQGPNFVVGFVQTGSVSGWTFGLAPGGINWYGDSTRIASGEWNFWAVTYTESTQTARLYINGNLVGSTVLSSAISATTTMMLLGSQNNSDYNADETARFPSVLSAAEVLWLYNAGAGRSRSDLPYMTLHPVAYWKLDETTGNRSDSAGTNHLSLGGDTHPTAGAGKIGNCSKSYSATAGFSFLSCPGGVLLRPATSISVAGWVKAEYMGPNPQAVFEIAEINGGFDYTGVNSRWGVAIEDSTLKFWVTNIDALDYDIATRDLSGVGTDTWFFFAAVIRDGNLCLSINGGTEDVVALQSANSTTPISKDFVVGYQSMATTTLEIDELGVFDIALSADDIAELYNSGAGVTYNP